ncbi:MAG: sensor histidine kinase [Prevotella sp.]
MQWTDRIRQVKLLLVLAAVFIAVASLVVSHFLTRDLEEEERSKVEVWAEAMRSLSHADADADLNLVLKVINENRTIPIVVMDSKRQVQVFRNISLGAKGHEDSLREVSSIGRRLLEAGRYIRIDLDDSIQSDYIDVCYDDSNMLRRLEIYPFVQLGVVLVFIIVAIFALLASKRVEQDKLWVGLSKETAHQLGTPISSLMAWSEMLRESYPDDELLPEMDKDVKRLQLIADRFSKIGSLPESIPTSLNEVMSRVVDYMDRRTSREVRMVSDFPDHDVVVNLNASLFEWVVENLAKNAVDALGGAQGKIVLRVEDAGNKAIVEVSDTGKGIHKKDLDNVFRPGFTTKRRGWGLGLSLARRIVEEYHKGRIYVKSSEVGKGTTFRIELRK